MTYHVDSEIGRLRQVILHRPGLELGRLTPTNVKSLLFDDILWAKRAREEHDAFAQVLRDRGVTVHYFGQLLAETLALPRCVRHRDTGCQIVYVAVPQLARLSIDAGE